MASTVTSTNNFSLRSILEKDKLTGSNFLDWERNLMIVLRHERKWYVLEEPLGEAPPANAPAAARNAHKKHSDDLLDVACLMLATMSPDLQAGLINTNAYDMIRQLRDMFQTQARTERYDATIAFNECKMVKGTSVSDHIMNMKRHLDHLERLGHPVPLQLATDTILNSLSEDYRPFVVNYNMNNMEKSIAELHSMLKTAELNLGNKNKTKDVLMVRDGGVKEKNGHASTNKGKGPVQAVQSAPKKGKSKGKGKKVKPNKARTENRCFTCNEVGHWRQNCPKRHEAGSYDQLLNNSYKRCRLKVAQILDRVANIGRDPRLRLLLGIITADLLEPFEEPEREFRKRNKKKSKASKVRPRALIFEMGDEAPMWTARRAAPTVPTNPITKPDLNKEIPGKLLHMIKDLTFDGKNDSNPIVHMENFVDICDLFKTEEGRDDAIHLRVFPLTLTGEARAWLRSLEPSSITTWEGLRSKFLSRFFPPSKIDKLRVEIRSFQQDDGETISEAWERFKHHLNSCPSHGLNKSEQVQTFYSGLAYSSRVTLDSSAGGVFMYKTPTEGYKLLEDMLIHNIDWRTDKRLQIPRMAGKISTEFDPSDELAAMKNQQVKFECKIEELIKSVHALQVGCEECNGLHLTKDFPNRRMMTPEEVNYINRGDYQGRWNNNRNFIPRPPGFFAPNQQNQRPDGEPRVSIEDRILQFMDAQKKLNDEVGSYLRNHQSTIQNLELQVGRVSQMLSERTQGELPTQTQVNPKVENAKPMLMMTGEPSKKKWTDIYTKKYVESDSGSEPDYATDYDSEGFTISFEHLGLKGPVASSDDEEEDGKQGGYAEFVISKKEDKGKEKEKEKAPEDDLIYIAPIKHDPGSYNLPISCHKFNGLALVDSGAALNMMPVGYCRKMGVKKIIPTDYQYRGVNGYMTKPLGITEGVPIRIGNFVYFTDFVIANLPKDTKIPIILGRSFLHTAQVNTDMRNQVTSLEYGENRIYFDPNGEPVRHLDEPYEDPSLAYKKSTNRPLLPHERGKKTEDYSNRYIKRIKQPMGRDPPRKSTGRRGARHPDVPRNEPKKGSSSRPIKK
ncbi:hypothetical protein OSB04_013058 [Centaurea solstitialis]|uniref:CCHC-type domain-containing protein n=1 Tax=Centaurea solstitialis TaxID=347529 RepID=A0AA38TEA0_9ASTR|nr:hypothetical protein OSB04_013058 [Centaurea solstitialis]